MAGLKQYSYQPITFCLFDRTVVPGPTKDIHGPLCPINSFITICEDNIYRSIQCFINNLFLRSSMLHSNPEDYAWGQGGLDVVITQVSHTVI